jgi:hypothetical protein
MSDQQKKLAEYLGTQMRDANARHEDELGRDVDMAQAAYEQGRAEAYEDALRIVNVMSPAPVEFAPIDIEGFDMRDGKYLVINEKETTQHHSGLMVTAQCLTNKTSSIAVEVIDKMIKEE